MIVLLGAPEDPEVLWLAAALRQHARDVEVVSTREMTAGSRLSVRIDRRVAASSLHLADGRCITHDGPRLVVNRLPPVVAPPPTGSATDDTYIVEEWRATLAAWLRTLRCPVLNPPRAAALAGPDFVLPAWRRIARAHGLHAAPWSSASETPLEGAVDVYCVAGVCIDSRTSVPGDVQARLCRMAAFVGAPLLGARFDTAGWTFLAATPTPSLRAGGEPLVDALLLAARA